MVSTNNIDTCNLKVLPLTPDLWPDIEDLFGNKSACNGCQCMYWRIGAAYRKRPTEENKQSFEAVVKAGPPPGLIAFDGRLPVGWCQLTSRDALPWLDRNWRLRRVDDLPVWSIPAFARAGFKTVASHVPARPIMRHDLVSIKR